MKSEKKCETCTLLTDRHSKVDSSPLRT